MKKNKNSSLSNIAEKRKNIRYPSDRNSLIELIRIGQKGETDMMIGLLINESWHGCCAVFKKPFPFTSNDDLIAHVGSLSNIKADIKWIMEIDDTLIKIGFYLW